MDEILIRDTQRKMKAAVAGPDWLADAKVWTNVMHGRSRWVNTPAALMELYELSARQIQSWGFDLDTLKAMLESPIVELVLPNDATDVAGAIRSLPWEFILSASSTGRPGAANAPLIIRYVEHVQAAETEPAPEPEVTRTAHFLQCSPGEIAQIYDFESECRLVTGALANWQVTSSTDPNLGEIKALVEKQSPTLIHITGVDLRQGAQMLPAAEATGGAGMYVKGLNGTPAAFGPEEIARALTVDGKRHPHLVAFNLYNGSELAAAAVAAGAGSAVAFLGEFDDATAEVFFSALYRAYATDERMPAPLAFRHGFETLRKDPFTSRHLEGAPIVMWSRQSILGQPAFDEPVPEEDASELDELTPSMLRKVLRPYVEFPKEINYCDLHNGRSFFDKGRTSATIGIRNPLRRRIRGVCVEVSLNVGGERAEYSRTLDVRRANHPIEKVYLSPTSDMVRSLRERIQANVTVKFSHDGHTISHDTQQVGLLAADEWDNRTPWLPSFVLPRDPAVVNVVRWAQPFLAALADTPDFGFDNYLRFAGPRDSKSDAIVDIQVKALWWAMRHHCSPSYLAAPPVYTRHAQRIRTPSAILEGKAGTCLDLALFFAACLAAVDLHAIVFVLKGHALPGYFRSPDGHIRFEKLMASNFPPASRSSDESVELNRGWVLEKDGYDKMTELIRAGDLVPIESTALTRRDGFDAAVSAGLRLIANAGVAGFISLYDLTLARRAGITPLPIAGLI